MGVEPISETFLTTDTTRLFHFDISDILDNEQTTCHRLAHWPFESV